MIAPKLRFSQFKDEWKSKKLGEIGEFINGLTYSPSDITNDENQLLVLRSSNIQDSQLAFDDNVFVNLIVEKEKFTQENDILICVRNGSRNLIGKNTIIKNLPYKATHGAFMSIYRSPFNSFIVQLFQTDKYYQYINADLGATINSINGSNIKKYKFYFPSEKEQTKIAEFLSAVDDKISQLSRQLELLNQYKKGVMQKIFSQEIRFKNDNGEDFGEWEEIQLKDFLTLTLRPVDKPNENYHALGVRSHFKGLFNKYDSQPEKNSMDVLYEVFENDIVVNITFAWEGAMAIANKIHHKGLVSHRFPTYQTDESKILLNFFRYIFIQKDFLAELQLCSPGGAGRNRVLSKKDFLEISILKPSVQEQAKIAEFLTAIDERIDHTTAQLTHTKQWKKGLLQQMFV